MTTVTSYVEQRLESISQRIMSASKLSEIIERFNLYQDLKQKLTSEEIIGKMRKDIKFETISTEVIDRRTGRATSATVAFKLILNQEPKRFDAAKGSSPGAGSRTKTPEALQTVSVKQRSLEQSFEVRVGAWTLLGILPPQEPHRGGRSALVFALVDKVRPQP